MLSGQKRSWDWQTKEIPWSEQKNPWRHLGQVSLGDKLDAGVGAVTGRFGAAAAFTSTGFSVVCFPVLQLEISIAISFYFWRYLITNQSIFTYSCEEEGKFKHQKNKGINGKNNYSSLIKQGLSVLQFQIYMTSDLTNKY